MCGIEIQRFFQLICIFVSHLFGGSLSGHVQSTAADGGGSRGKGSGRADKEGGNSELHLDNLFVVLKVRVEMLVAMGRLAAMEQQPEMTY